MERLFRALPLAAPPVEFRRFEQSIGDDRAFRVEDLYALKGGCSVALVIQREKCLAHIEPSLGCFGMVDVGKCEILERDAGFVILLELHLGLPQVETRFDAVGGVGIRGDEVLELVGGEVVHSILKQTHRELEFGVLL